MNKKATLLIINIEKIYTMQEKQNQDIILKNAFIAIHHDKIMAMGLHDYQQFIDKDTRIIDARGHIAIPGFIEPCATYQFEALWKKQSYRYDCMRKGVLTMAMPYKESYLEVDIVKAPQKIKYPVFYGQMIIKMMHWKKRKYFCISGYDEHFRLMNPLLLAQLLYIKFQIEPLHLLKAMTIYPAKALKLEQVGKIEVHAQADLLLCATSSIETLFQGIDQDRIVQVIKRGIRIYPFVLIS